MIWNNLMYMTFCAALILFGLGMAGFVTGPAASDPAFGVQVVKLGTLSVLASMMLLYLAQAFGDKRRRQETEALVKLADTKVRGGYRARILADSVATTASGERIRLTTVEVRFPRFILAQLNTHRMLSRNAASSRAIPVRKLIKNVLRDPYVPETFGANKRGMQAGAAVRGWRSVAARYTWLALIYVSCFFAWIFSKLGIHKQWANRVIELFSWHTAIISATEWENFFNLRCHPDAQPEIRILAELIRDAMNESTPEELSEGDWHLPFIYEEDREEESSVLELVKVAVGRCARVSYLTHFGKRDLSADKSLCNKLAEDGHMSPFEHVAQVVAPKSGENYGNFSAPWKQYRKFIPGEAVFRGNQ